MAETVCNKILEYVKTVGRRQRPSEIRSALGIKNRMYQYAIKKLRNMGMIVEEPDPNNCRAKFISLKTGVIPEEKIVAIIIVKNVETFDPWLKRVA